MTRVICALLLTLITAISPLAAERRSDPLPLVEQLVITAGHTGAGGSFDQSAVRARLKTREGDFFSQDSFDEDLKTLAEEYHRVVPEVEFAKGKVYITLKVWPKPHIRSITFTGNNKIKEKTLKKKLETEPQTIFDRKAFNEAFHKVQAHYVKEGYFEAELRYNVTPVEESNEVDIEIVIEEGRAGKVQKIVFINFSADEEYEVSKMIYTKKFHFIKSLMGPEGTFHPDVAEQDRITVTQFLHDRGYPDAQVDIRVVESKSKNRIVLEFHADKGEIYNFGAITFEGNQLFDDEQIEKLIAIKPGDPFSPQAMHDTSKRLGELYGKRGYVDAYVAYEPHLDPECRRYDVHFTINEAERYRVGLVKVFGNNCTDSTVILHETLLVPGDTFNMDKLRATEQRLSNIGYFEHVNVYAVRSEEAELLGGDYRDVYIEVEEQSTGDFSFSAGYSTSEKLFGSIALTERNFNIAGITDLARCGYQGVRGGGEYLYLRTSIGEQSKQFYGSWAKPHFWDSCWTVGIDTEVAQNRARARDYDTQSYGMSVFGKYTINQFLRAGVHYRWRHSQISDLPEDAPESLQREKKNAGSVSAIGASLVYNSTDHPVKPTKGLRSELFAEYAGLGGKHEFWSFAYLNSYYFQPWCCWNFSLLPRCIRDGGIMKFRGDMRFKVPEGDSVPLSLPIDERFFLGGEGTVRGYRPYSLGPLHSNSDPTGGISSWLASAEYTQVWNDIFEAFVFIDGGNVNLLEFSLTPRMEWSWGYGARVQFMQNMPPITLGMGYPINPLRRQDEKNFFFSLGGRF